MIIVDGITYNVPILSLEETCEFLDKFAERTEDGVLHRELIGVYFNQQINFGRPANKADLVALWDKLTEPVEFHTVTVPDQDGVDFSFSAYISGVRRSLKVWKPGTTTWEGVTAKFTAQAPARS